MSSGFVMARIPILSLTDSDARHFLSRAAHGDAAAQRELSELFVTQEWKTEGEFNCFLCDKTQAVSVAYPAFYLLPDPHHEPDYLVVGICGECHSLPQLMRLAKARKILRAWVPAFRINLAPAKRIKPA